VRDYRAEARGGCALHWRHFRAMLVKRARISARDSKALCYQLLIPVIMVAVGMALLKAGQFTVFPEYQFSTANFNVNARLNGAAPLYPNYVPYFQYKSTPNASDAADIDGVMGAMPPANVSSPAVMAFTTAEAAAIPDPFHFVAPTAVPPFSDWQRMSAFLINDKPTYAASKYGAYIFTRDGTQYAGQAVNVSAPDDPVATYSAFVNTTGRHAGPLFMNLMDAALLRRYSGNSAADITARTQPLPFTKRQASVFSAVFSFACAIIVVMAFAFIPASYAIYVVKEREVKAKHQQLISGVSLPAYWLSTFTYDNLTYLIPAGLSILIMWAFDISDFVSTTSNRAGALLLLFWLYGTSVSAFTYLLSYAFKSHSTAQNVVLFINVFCMILMIASLIMSQVDTTCRADQTLRYFYRLLPGFGLGNGLLQLSFLDLLPVFDATCDRVHGIKVATIAPYGALDARATGINLAFMAVETVVYLAAAILVDVARSHPRLLLMFQRDPKVVDEPVTDDVDVAAERDRVAAEISGVAAARAGGGDAGNASRDVILLEGLRKVYDDGKVAVRGLSYGIPAGQVFGFLGINGAGKTTTLQMLSGDVLPSSGTASLAGFDIISQQPKVRRLLGYAPQWDALLELLTAREHLELYARIKGVREADLAATVDEQLRRMDLVEFANKKAGTLSGGNKRKLSVAIALIGPGNLPPPIIFLDEPSTGMDPVARRYMWKVIADVATRDKACSIILTTHSMEECEALCQRVGIMVGGRLRCLGSIQHLKNRFGRGFQVEMMLGEPAPAARAGVEGSVRAALGTTTEDAAAAAGPAPITPRGATHIARREVASVAAALGAPERVAQINERGAGWTIDAAFERSDVPTPGLPPHAPDRAIPVADFAAWWAGEDAVAAAVAYMTVTAFPGASLLERQGLQLRFQLPPQREPLGVMFAKVEGVRARLGILSYMLGQTTLEQVFNTFAREQREERGVARGFAEGGAAGTAPAPVAAPPIPAAAASRAGGTTPVPRTSLGAVGVALSPTN